ncbi:MAG: hypothetical protein RJQ04_02715, partial [Longimicrobiales bacterium]
GEFTVVGDRSDGKFKNDVKVFVNGVEVEKIHTSCSKPIGPGAVFGDLKVVAAVSKDNGPVCPLTTTSAAAAWTFQDPGEWRSAFGASWAGTEQ